MCLSSVGIRVFLSLSHCLLSLPPSSPVTPLSSFPFPLAIKSSWPTKPARPTSNQSRNKEWKPKGWEGLIPWPACQPCQPCQPHTYCHHTGKGSRRFISIGCTTQLTRKSHKYVSLTSQIGHRPKDQNDVLFVGI